MAGFLLLVVFLFPLFLFGGERGKVPPSVAEYLYQTALRYKERANYIGALEILRFLGNYKNATTLYGEIANFFKPIPVKRLKGEPLVRVKLTSFERLTLVCSSEVYRFEVSRKGEEVEILLNGERMETFPTIGGENCRLYTNRRFMGFIPKGGNLSVKLLKGEAVAILNLPLEEYLRGVLPAEVYPSWHIEALKAQAVASRTYALFNIYRAREAGKPFDVEASTNFQAFTLRRRGYPRIDEAVEKTRGEVLTYNGSLIYAMFNSNNGGCSHSFEEITGIKLPYLSPVRTPVDISNLKWSRWKRHLPVERVENFLSRMGLAWKVSSLRVVRNKCGRGLLVIIQSMGGESLTLPLAVFFRLEMHLPSDWFYLKGREGNAFLLDGRGFGHGLGMSQWGAYRLANDGWNYRRILKLYYKGTQIKKVY